MSISEENFRKYMYDRIVDDFSSSMHRYVIHGIHPGGGFSAILANDLFRATQTLHLGIQTQMADYAHWVIMSMPPESFGSYDAIDDWCENRDGIRSEYVRQLEHEMTQHILQGTMPRHGPVHGHLPQILEFDKE